jgi:hypothetical protein
LSKTIQLFIVLLKFDDNYIFQKFKLISVPKSLNKKWPEIFISMAEDSFGSRLN